MSRNDIEQVLCNWIEQALAPDGRFAEGINPAKWVADNFVAWWQNQVDDSLGSVELAALRLRDELQRLRSSAELDEALHELSHLQDGLCDLRQNLGLSGDAANAG